MATFEKDKDIIERIENPGTGSTSLDSGVRVLDSRSGSPNEELWWSRFRAKHQNFFSEFFGVFIMILFGNGSVAQVVLSLNKNGDYQSITWGMLSTSLDFDTTNRI